MDVEPFDFKGQQVRVITINPDNPLWVARDVAIALGYKNPSDAVMRHCKGVAIHDTLPTAGGRQKYRVINESNVYRLIVGSDLDTAQEFERVVFEEILPSIRKRGGYLTPAAAEQAITDPDFIIRLATSLKEERARRTELESQAEENRPKVLFADAVSTAKTHVLVGDLAKILRGNGIPVGGTRMFKWLRAHGFLVSRRGMDWNMPTQRSMELGLFKVKETTVVHSDGHTSLSKTPKVTGKGQAYFISRFMDGRFSIDQVA